MKKNGFSLGVALALLTLAACDPEAWRKARLKDFNQRALPRASFELNCSKERIEVVEVSPQETGWVGSQVGVTGCGRRAVYVLTEQDWMNNTGVQSSPATGEQAQ